VKISTFKIGFRNLKIFKVKMKIMKTFLRNWKMEKLV